MSETKPKNSDSEDVDLGQLFSAVGRLFEKLFSFIGRIFQILFSTIIYSLKPLVKNFKLIAIALFASAILGFIAEKFKTPIYQSDMLVRPYFGSKYQLSNNVNYFNALIGEGNLQELSRIFEIDSAEAGTLIEFIMEVGPETDNDLLVEYDAYIKSIDSTLADDVSYEEFIENRDILNAGVFSITASAKKNNVFISLERGFRKTFENDYSIGLREKRDDTIRLRRTSLEKQLEEIKSLQKIYVSVIEKEAEKPEVSIGPEGMFPLQQTKRKTNEYELLERELRIRSSINSLDEQLAREDRYYDILAGFEEVGTRTNPLTQKYSLVFPAAVFLLIVGIYLSRKVFEYIKNYEQ